MILVEVRKEAIDAVYKQLPPDFRSLVTSELCGLAFPEVLAKFNAYWSGNEGEFLRGLIGVNSRGLSKLNCATFSSLLLAYLHLASATYDNDIETMNTFRMLLLSSAYLFDHVSHYAENGCLELDSSRMAHSNLNGAWEFVIDWPLGCIRWMSPLTKLEFFDEYAPVIWRKEKADPVESVWFCDNDKLVRLSLEREDHSLRRVLLAYANSKKAPVKSFRYSILRNSKPLYLSEIGRKTTKDVGLVDGDIIMCELMKQCPSPTVAREPIPAAKPNRKKGKSKKKTKQRMKRRSVHPTQYQPVKDEGSYRVEHSKKLSLVFEEADGTLKAIRQKLNDLQLKRTPPKSAAALPGPKVDRIEPSAAFDTGPQPGKAGKVYYDVRVGESASLYKTTKPSRRNMFDSAASITIDLHGCTREEGKAKLDSCLPVWIRSAMEGSYPWVTRVRIVCGGGSQILSEMVEGWIKAHDTVANSINS